ALPIFGKKSDYDVAMKKRIKRIITIVFGHEKLFKDKKSGFIHLLLFYGFLLVQFGAIDMFIKGLAPGNHLPLGPLYPGFKFFQELVTLTILVAIVLAFYRRYMEKLPRLERGFQACLVLIFIGTLMLTVLLGNGFSQVWHSVEGSWTEPVATALSAAFAWMSPFVAKVSYYVVWWIHTLTILIFLVYIPQSKHAHLLAAPVNVFFTSETAGKLEPIDFDAAMEDEENMSFGVGKVEDFTQRQMIDYYACTECGRCTDVCPASGTGKMLSPMDIMLKIRDHLNEKGTAVTGKSPWVPAYAFNNTRENSLASMGREEASNEMASVSLIGDVITEEELSACTTCRNCEDACPVMNEHVSHIIDLRRYLVMTEGKIDPEAQRAVMNIERQGNPWGLSKRDRIKWRDLEDTVYIPTVQELRKEGKEFEYLFWVSS